MKFLATVQYVHRDLATRNCLVYPGYKVKIADCGAARPAYNCDYYSLGEGEDRIPIRWMAWEAVLLVIIFSATLRLLILSIAGCVHDQE